MNRDFVVELGGIEPPSVMRSPYALRPFPRFRLAVAGLPGQAVLADPPPGLSPVPAFFHAVSGLSLLSPVLLLPGCTGQAPRAIAGRDVSLRP
jgi:hypothetical protein